MILDNPFHIIGLPADCTAREKAKREGQIKAFLRIGKPLEFGDDDLFFEGCRRNQATVDRSLAALYDANDRLGCGLFWFTRSGLLDEHALRLVRRHDLRGAFRIWQRIEKRCPTPNYASSLNNFGTLCLLVGIKVRSGWSNDKSVRTRYILRGLRAKAKVVASLSAQDLSDYCTTFSDDVAARNSEDIAFAFGRALDVFVAEADKYGIQLDNNALIHVLEVGGARMLPLKSKYVSVAREQLDRAVKVCAASLETNESQAARSGTTLMETARRRLPELAAVVATTDIAYTRLADGVANQLLDAAVTHFNYHANAETMSLEVVQVSASLVSYASEIACGVVARERAQDNLDTVQEIEDDQRKKRDMESVRNALGAWIERSGNLFNQDPTPVKQVEFVRQAMSKNSGVHGSALVLLESLRRQGTKVFGPAFSNSEEFVSAGTLVCRMLVGHAVSAYNRSTGESEQDAAKLFPRINRHFTSASEASEVHRYAFPVEEECYTHMMRNSALASNSLRQGSNLTSEATGCLVNLFWVVVIGFVLSFLGELFN
ncbi:MAG: hypothetical protein OYK82_07590 [Gammaproteobacteria bacterium]|nr:hypothetical protein [Gammaproteobacteria bacterium]